MALLTFLDITVQDAQGYQGTVEFRIKPAAYGATTIPTEAKIQAVADALFGDTKLSSGEVVFWQIRIVEDGVAGGGGNGNTPTSEALRFRSDLNELVEWLARVPGANKANLAFDPQNPNSVSTTGALWTALRAALVDSEIAVSAPTGAYAATTSGDLAEVASVYDGRRSPLRPR